MQQEILNLQTEMGMVSINDRNGCSFVLIFK